MDSVIRIYIHIHTLNKYKRYIFLIIDLYDMQCNAFLPMQSIRSLLHHSIYFLIINWIIKIGTTTTKYKYVYFKISKRQAPAGRGPGGMIERRREEEERREE